MPELSIRAAIATQLIAHYFSTVRDPVTALTPEALRKALPHMVDTVLEAAGENPNDPAFKNWHSQAQPCEVKDSDNDAEFRAVVEEERKRFEREHPMRTLEPAKEVPEVEESDEDQKVFDAQMDTAVAKVEDIFKSMVWQVSMPHCTHVRSKCTPQQYVIGASHMDVGVILDKDTYLTSSDYSVLFERHVGPHKNADDVAEDLGSDFGYQVSFSAMKKAIPQLLKAKRYFSPTGSWSAASLLQVFEYVADKHRGCHILVALPWLRTVLPDDREIDKLSMLADANGARLIYTELDFMEEEKLLFNFVAVRDNSLSMTYAVEHQEGSLFAYARVDLSEETFVAISTQHNMFKQPAHSLPSKCPELNRNALDESAGPILVEQPPKLSEVDFNWERLEIDYGDSPKLSKVERLENLFAYLQELGRATIMIDNVESWTEEQRKEAQANLLKYGLRQALRHRCNNRATLKPMAKSGSVHSVENCARCGEDHSNLVFYAFDGDADDVAFGVTHWAMCPTTKAPILMVKTSDEQDALDELKALVSPAPRRGQFIILGVENSPSQTFLLVRMRDKSGRWIEAHILDTPQGNDVDLNAREKNLTTVYKLMQDERVIDIEYFHSTSGPVPIISMKDAGTYDGEAGDYYDQE